MKRSPREGGGSGNVRVGVNVPENSRIIRCEQCGVFMVPKTQRQICCSDRCRQRKNMASKRVAAAKWKRANRPAVKAHHVVEQAIRTGTLERGPCVICAALPTIFHHEQYSDPLDVISMCRKCHWHHHNVAPLVGRAA